MKVGTTLFFFSFRFACAWLCAYATLRELTRATRFAYAACFGKKTLTRAYAIEFLVQATQLCLRGLGAVKKPLGDLLG